MYIHMYETQASYCFYNTESPIYAFHTSMAVKPFTEALAYNVAYT